MENALSQKEMICNIPAESQLMADGSISGYSLTIGDNVAPLTVGDNSSLNQGIYQPQPQYVWDWWAGAGG